MNELAINLMDSTDCGDLFIQQALFEYLFHHENNVRSVSDANGYVP